MSREVVILSAARTPVGRYLGTLAAIPAVKLGAIAIAEAVKRAGIDATDVEEVIMGNVLQAGQGQNPARQASWPPGSPSISPPGPSTSSAASGMKTVHVAAQAIKAGDAEVIVAGGMENMSMAPYLVPKARKGYRMGDGVLHGRDDPGRPAVRHEQLSTWASPPRTWPRSTASPGRCRTRSATRASRRPRPPSRRASSRPRSCRWRSRRRKGDPSLRHRRARPRRHHPGGSGQAQARLQEGRHRHRRQRLRHQRRRSRLRGRFARNGPTRRASSLWRPWSGYATAALDPAYMGMGPFYATKKVLEKTGMTVEQMDVIESNEAFAAQAGAVAQELGFDMTQDQHLRRGHRPGPPHRGLRRPHPHHPHPCSEAGGRHLRSGHHVHRRRPGHRHHRQGLNLGEVT